MKKSSALWLLVVALAAGCATDDQYDAQDAQPPAGVQEGKSNNLDFLADMPSLKNVSLKMSEQDFLAILKQEKIPYTREVKTTRETSYYARPRPHVIVVFGFVSGYCSAIQRLRD